MESKTEQSQNTYHHGDLYRTLLASASEMIAEGGSANLSMRKLADRTGVSRTAPYHHFKDKNALLCAIAEEGFRRQEGMLAEILRRSESEPLQYLFGEYVHAYIEAAHQYQEQYDLMFGREIWRDGKPTESLQQLSHQHFQNWLGWIEQLQDQGILTRDEPALRMAQTCWATLHGICRLLNDGVYTEQSNLQEMCETAIRMLLRN